MDDICNICYFSYTDGMCLQCFIEYSKNKHECHICRNEI